MPRQFLPQKSGPHRIACIALYRALLSQCSRLELPAASIRGPINPIKHLIRKQFQRNKRDTSARLAVAALKVGYDAEELLHSANTGDQAAYSKVLNLLEEIQLQGDIDRARNATNPPPHKPRPRKPEPYPGAPKMLESRPRPASELTGQRHIPVLVGANGLPFLRFKKPQSPFLSRVLGAKRKQKQKQMDHVQRIDESVRWAVSESQWEDRVGAQQDGIRWERDLRSAKREVVGRIAEGDAKARELARKMLRIVDEESRLAAEERKGRKVEMKRKKRNLKRSGGSSDGTYAAVKSNP